MRTEHFDRAALGSFLVEAALRRFRFSALVTDCRAFSFP
jgi:hypothetical protein